MDLTKVKQLRRSLTLHFAIIAWLTAMLVATGSGSIFLPMFIFFVSLGAFVFVDQLEWFELGRIGTYIGMTAATSIAVASYIYSAFYVPSESGQLMAVAGLLVYPEAVLFLQRKNLRIFEQLAVFLLLEMIVAALVNDNVMFGVLLTPIILLWVSSLFLFSRYATLVHIDPEIETPLPKLAEVLFKRFMKTVLGDGSKAKAVTSHLVMEQNVQRSLTWRRLLQSFPIGVGALAFAGMFFYFLPRTTPGSLQTGMGNQARVGLPNVLKFGEVGRILQNREAVMRVSLRHALSGDNYAVDQDSPPYLRAMCFDSYGPNSRRVWIERGEWQTMATPRHGDLPSVARLRPLTDFGRDLVHVEFDIRSRFASSMYTLPPVFATNKSQRVTLNHDPVHMLLQKLDESTMMHGKSLVYQIGSAGFSSGRQLPVTPARMSFRNRDQTDRGHERELRYMKLGFSAFDEVNKYRLRLLERENIDLSQDPFKAARAMEDHFVFSGNFTYSLDLRPPSDPDMDPIEDFVAHQRSGHCQYFASALTAMLRQSGIPSRIVIGYRPKEYNRLGKYFLVRQSDAHAWVEALFSHEQLEGTEYQRWLTDAKYYWVRFDPTPSSNGEDVEIVEQSGQAIDFAEKLWKDYVVEGQKLSGENSLYAPVAENSQDAYAELVAKFNRLKSNFEQGQLFSFGGLGMAWPIVIILVTVLGLALALWQLIVFLPRIAPRLALRLGVAKPGHDVRHPFFARCLKLLEQLGVRRKPHETPREFTRDAQQVLRERGQTADGALDYLTTQYYRFRFGDQEEPTAEETQSIDQELARLEQTVAAARR